MEIPKVNNDSRFGGHIQHRRHPVWTATGQSALGYYFLTLFKVWSEEQQQCHPGTSYQRKFPSTPSEQESLGLGQEICVVTSLSNPSECTSLRTTSLSNFFLRKVRTLARLMHVNNLRRKVDNCKRA